MVAKVELFDKKLPNKVFHHPFKNPTNWNLRLFGIEVDPKFGLIGTVKISKALAVKLEEQKSKGYDYSQLLYQGKERSDFQIELEAYNDIGFPRFESIIKTLKSSKGDPFSISHPLLKLIDIDSFIFGSISNLSMGNTLKCTINCKQWVKVPQTKVDSKNTSSLNLINPTKTLLGRAGLNDYEKPRAVSERAVPYNIKPSGIKPSPTGK